MSKITPAILKEKQFLPEHFNPVVDFDVFLQSVIDTQEALLKVRIGATSYFSSDASLEEQVKHAALNMACDDLTQRRILRISGNVNEDSGPMIKTLMAVRTEFKDEAAAAISRIINVGTSTDSDGFASGVAVTSHFDGSAA